MAIHFFGCCCAAGVDDDYAISRSKDRLFFFFFSSAGLLSSPILLLLLSSQPASQPCVDSGRARMGRRGGRKSRQIQASQSTFLHVRLISSAFEFALLMRREQRRKGGRKGKEDVHGCWNETKPVQGRRAGRRLCGRGCWPAGWALTADGGGRDRDGDGRIIKWATHKKEGGLGGRQRFFFLVRAYFTFCLRVFLYR
jgi:hypothetical protein